MTLPVKKLKAQLLEVHEKTGITTFISSGILNNERVAKKFATTMGELAERTVLLYVREPCDFEALSVPHFL